MKSEALALLGIFLTSALAVPGVKRHEGGSDQPISDGKGAPILGL